MERPEFRRLLEWPRRGVRPHWSERAGPPVPSPQGKPLGLQKISCIRFLAVLALLFGLPEAGWTLFTGDDQFDRNHLNTERPLGPGYFLDLLAFRPFWRPLPGAENPSAYVRNSEGSLDSDRLYIWREVGVRGRVTPRSFWGYGLRQKEDMEQSYFYQLFEAQTALAGPLSFRIFGEPTFKKQSSDIGGGVVLSGDRSALRLDVTRVDFNFTEKNLDNEKDRRKLYNVLLIAQVRHGLGAAQISIEWDSPVEREFLSEGNRFGHKNVEAGARSVLGPFDVELGWQEEHRSLDGLAAGERLQDFRKEVYRGEAAGSFRWRDRPFRLGAQVQRRRADFTPALSVAQDRFHRQRWEADPYLGIDWPIGSKMALETAVYQSLVWEKTRIGTSPESGDFTWEGKAKTALRIDFTLNVTLVMNATWDLDRFGTDRTFGGGNVQFQARIP